MSLNEMNKHELKTAVGDANEIIYDLIECIETLPLCLEDFIGVELCERIREWNKQFLM